MLQSGKPRHQQISDTLRQQIQDGTMGPNDQLLSENQLGEEFQVSRITVRRALQTLENEGLIYRRQGLGAFVSDQRVSQSMIRLNSFVEDMELAGLKASSQIIGFTKVVCPDPIAHELRMELGKHVFRLDRLRLGDETPIAYDITFLPPFYAQLLDGFDLETDTIYRILEEEFEIPILMGRYRLDAANAEESVATHLQVPVNKALFLIERISVGAKEKPVYFQRRFYRTDRVKYEVELARDKSESGKGFKTLPLREFAPVFKKTP